MDRHGDVVAKGMVVQNIDREEEQDVDHPATYRDMIRLEEERRSSLVELRDVSRGGDEEELDERQEGAAVRLDPVPDVNVLTGISFQRRVAHTYLTIASSAKT